MIGFSDIQTIVKEDKINTHAFGGNYTFPFAIGDVTHPHDAECWVIVAKANEENLNWGFHLNVIPIRDSEGKIKAGQVVNEFYSDEAIRKKGIPENLILKWVEHYNLPLFSSVPALIAPDFQIYDAENRVKEATSVWKRLQQLVKHYAGYEVKYYPIQMLYVIIPANTNLDELLFLKMNYFLPEIQANDDENELGEDEKERELPW
ncbi:hypothetical protein HDF19_19725 [Mucilaginibacter sp. E4BP6]|uniref:hypothetical protein n=1 Tax=Mucilaginibacter sp. E4BP6 TaxID=2723089 RepID=UPI0015C7A08F|nr:hypothetical protein [Mucilaginibacter sp. E4BP6]NYE67220.1 hypothetical protein [Mucilaginibacter sp. E4BP6]